jgi:hypothetical protein
MMNNENMVVVHIDKATSQMVDMWRHRSLLQPSRRQAVRALLRQALRAHEVKAIKAAAPEQTAVAS